MKSFLIVFALVLIGIVNISEGTNSKRDSVIVVSADSTHYRSYEADWYPGIDPRIIELKGVEGAKDDHNDITLDAVDFVITNFNQTAVAFSYFHEEALIHNVSNPNDASLLDAAAFAFFVRAYTAFEFVEGNGIPGYQNNTADTVTGFYDLSSLELPWKPMGIDSFNVTDANGQQFAVWSITMQTVDEVFLMRFLVGGTNIAVNGVLLNSDTMKIDFEVRWFTPLHVSAGWTTGPSNHTNAQVGFLVFAVALAEEVTVNTTAGNETANPSIQLAAGEFVGFFTWEVTADVTVSGFQAVAAVSADIIDDGEEIQIGEEEIARVIFFSFDGYRPSLVSWDPEIGAVVPYNKTAPATSGFSSTTVRGSSTTVGGSSTTLGGSSTTGQGTSTSTSTTESEIVANGANFIVVPSLFLLMLIISFLF